MADPVSFDGSNTVLVAPPDMDNCEDLPVLRLQYAEGRALISCWKLTREELEEIARTGQVWLVIWGDTMAPAYVGGVKPFELQEHPSGPHG